MCHCTHAIVYMKLLTSLSPHGMHAQNKRSTCTCMSLLYAREVALDLQSVEINTAILCPCMQW